MIKVGKYNLERLVKMKVATRFKKSLQGLIDAIARYPLTTAFLLAAVSVNAASINARQDYYLKYIVTFVVGAFLSAAAQMAYERFYKKIYERLVLFTICIFLSVGYYLIVRTAPRFSMEIGVRTSVALFALFIGFVWIPSIRMKTTFNETFMAAFKGFFISLFFSAVLFGGISLIIGATDQLLFNISSKAYSHSSNIVFFLFAPIYFLSMIPLYNIKKRDNESDSEYEAYETNLQRIVSCPKYLEILLSYIIIPLAAVFTIILLAYIFINIMGRFWTDNLMEPMLVSYSIVVILLYILASNLENRFAVNFRRIFPKVLIPIVFFQTIASVLKIGETGITHGRYYVILYGVFGIIAGIVFSFMSVRKNGIIAMVLIAFSVISIIPPTDAFSISKMSQINLLEKTLLKNSMIVNGMVTPKADISNDDKKIITNSANYISMMEYTDEIAWLPDDFKYYENFEKTFGFSGYDIREPERIQYYSFGRGQEIALNIDEYDIFIKASLPYYEEDEKYQISKNELTTGETFSINKIEDKRFHIFTFYDKDRNVIIDFDFEEVFKRYEGYYSPKGEMSLKDATFEKENEKVSIKIIMNFVDFYMDGKEERFGGDMYIFIKYN